MSLNVENLFVKCDEQAKVAEYVDAYWRSAPPAPQPDWGLPSSFEPLLAKEPKRKVAISPPRDGWVALVESKEVVDFALAKTLSERLRTAVLAIQVSESTGGAGYASAVEGQILESHFGEEDDNPLASIREVLRKYKVPFDATLFRETFQDGWNLKQKQ